MGGCPKKRLYSRLNWLALSYPTSSAAVAASRPPSASGAVLHASEAVSDPERDFHPEWLRVVRPDPRDRFCCPVALVSQRRNASETLPFRASRIDPLFQAPDPARVQGASVTFEPGARTAWHTHPLGQTLIVGKVVDWMEHVSDEEYR